MFIRLFADIREDFETVEAVLLEPAEIWLPGLSVESGSGGARPVVELTFLPGGVPPGKNVRLELGPVRRDPTKTSMAIRWSATGPGKLFPGLSGILEVARFGPADTLLALLVEYQPPFGKLGAVLDRVLLHNIAELTLRQFRDRLAASLESLAHESPAPAASPHAGPSVEQSREGP